MTEPTPSTNSAKPVAEPGLTSIERVHLPRISIKFCTQCRWMLRAAYFAQELLSTFGTDLGEVALVPMTGGVFTVTIWHPESTSTDNSEVKTQEIILWDRKRDGGFPEVKALKSLVRNVIAPERDLGHTDRALKKEQVAKKELESQGDKKPEIAGEKKECEDCV
ncbi:uncharacterized protein N7483_010034 [Penicillium malachiteum]|uniref:uncharacterized protein n=1 Tax=Penicillium malachiteum TaxID=1324776 RepID=UPI0025499B57|nr:uncharacterized protein N7483_010034 [Penicillium malachiteum]KAJ5712853.1 hypothetical protein N7483_010034 [Penicillium malachiteum]